MSRSLKRSVDIIAGALMFMLACIGLYALSPAAQANMASTAPGHLRLGGCSAAFDFYNDYYGVWLTGDTPYQWESGYNTPFCYEPPMGQGASHEEIYIDTGCIELDSSTGGLHTADNTTCTTGVPATEWNFVPTGGGTYEIRSWWEPANDFCILAQPSGDTTAYTTCPHAVSTIEFHLYSVV
jgi:hypothetical protein